MTNKPTSSAWGTRGSQPSLHIFPIWAILGEQPGQPFILGGFIPTYKGLAQLCDTLALRPGKQQMEIPGINVLDYWDSALAKRTRFASKLETSSFLRPTTGLQWEAVSPVELK